MQLRHILNYVGSALFLASILGLAGCQLASQLDANGTDRAGAAPIEEEATSTADRSGVLVMAHGGNAAWNRAVEAVVEPLRQTYPIEIAFGMAKTSTMRDAVGRLEQQGVNRIAVVRMFISGESFLGKTQYILGLPSPLDGKANEAVPAHSSARQYSSHTMSNTQHSSSGHTMEPPKPIDSDAVFMLSQEGVSASPLVDDILIERARSLSVDPLQECVVILGHGPGDDDENERWLANMHRRAERLRSQGQYRDVWCETLREDWPDRRAAAEERIREHIYAHERAGQRVIVVPFRVAGFGPYEEVLDGLNYIADGAGFCPHPNMTRWIDQTARASDPSLPTALLSQ
jgi:sirohydrochlorin ferrochelatase